MSNGETLEEQRRREREEHRRSDDQLTDAEKLSGKWVHGNDGYWYEYDWVFDNRFPYRRVSILGVEPLGSTHPGQVGPGRQSVPSSIFDKMNRVIPQRTTLGDTDKATRDRLGGTGGGGTVETILGGAEIIGAGADGLKTPFGTIKWGDLLKAGVTAFQLWDYMKKSGHSQEMLDKAMQYFDEDRAAREPFQQMLGEQLGKMGSLERPDLSQAFAGTSNPFARPIERDVQGMIGEPPPRPEGTRDNTQDRDRMGGGIPREPEPPVGDTYGGGRRPAPNVEAMIGPPPSGAGGPPPGSELEMATSPAMELPEWLKKYLERIQ